MSVTVSLIDVRGFLEGVEIPVISASVQMVTDSPAMLSLQVVYTDALLELRDRTVVHIFFKEVLDFETDYPLKDYELFYAGEIRAIEVVKQAGSRSAIIYGEDSSAYWDVCTQYTQNFSAGGDAFWDRTSSFVGANKGMFDNILRNPVTVMAGILNAGSKTRPEIQGLMGGVLGILERMGGVYTINKPFRGHNDFYSAAELRMRILDQIGVAEKDTTSAKLFNNKAFVEFITGSLASFGGIISYRDMLKVLFSYVFHESAPNPLAYYSTAGTYTQTTDYQILSVEWKRLFAVIESMRKAIQTLAYPTEGMSFKDRKLYDIARLGGKDVYILKLLPEEKRPIRIVLAQKASLQSVLDHYNTLEGGHHVTPSIRQAQEYVRQAENKMWAENLPECINLMKQALDALATNKVIARSGSVPAIVSYTKTRAVRDGLYTQIMFPNLFFAPPPRCNVIFPDMYSDMQYKRDFRQEITRMRLSIKCWLTGSGGTAPYHRGNVPTSLLGAYYYAPNVVGVGEPKEDKVTVNHVKNTGVTDGEIARADLLRMLGRSSEANAITHKVKKTVKRRKFLDATEYAARVILPHERFGGIIPSMQALGRVNFYVARKDPEYKENGGGIPYAQRSANFKFFMDRFAARQLSLTGVFNKNLVCGLPALVIDKYDTSTTETAYNLSEIPGYTAPGRKPTQYLGKIQQLVHSLSATQAPSTVVAMSNVRTHNERDEFLGTTDPEISKKNDGSRPRLSDAREIQDWVHSLKTSLDEVARDTDNLVYAPRLVFVFKHWKEGVEKHAAQAEEMSLQMQAKILNRIGVAITQAEIYLKKNMKQQCVGELQQASSMAGLITTQTIDDGALGSDFIPAEEILRPPWYDPIYDNKRIGRDFYMPILGCLSLTDPNAFTSEETQTILSTSSPYTIQHAVDKLVQTYGAIKRGSENAMSFIRAYTQRPIATFDQVMNTFHRFAYGDVSDFSDMLANPIPGAEYASATVRSIHTDMDVRSERRDAVLVYVGELDDLVVLG